MAPGHCLHWDFHLFLLIFKLDPSWPYYYQSVLSPIPHSTKSNSKLQSWHSLHLGSSLLPGLLSQGFSSKSGISFIYPPQPKICSKRLFPLSCWIPAEELGFLRKKCKQKLLFPLRWNPTQDFVNCLSSSKPQDCIQHGKPQAQLKAAACLSVMPCFLRIKFTLALLPLN